MAGDPTAGGVGGRGSSGGKGSSRSSSRHQQFRNLAKTRVDDLQEMFSGLQSARKESRSADAALLEEQVHHMLREWRAELSVPSPASSLQNSQSQGNKREASDPPSETLRLLQLAGAEEEDDATSKLVMPRSPLPMPASSHEGHGHGQAGHNLNPVLQGGTAEMVPHSPLQMPSSHQSHGHGQNLNPNMQGEAVLGSAAAPQQSLDQGMQDDCGDAAGAANAMFHDQLYYIDHELDIDDFLRDDDYKMNLSGSNPDGPNTLQGLDQLEHQQYNLPLDLPPPNSYVDTNNSAQSSGDVFFHMSDLLTTMYPSPSQYLGPKCALWDCGRPVRGSEECKDYCNPYHAGLALNDDGLLGTRPVMRPRGIDLKDGPLFAALSAKNQGKNVGIPVCEGAATTKSPWNAPELFDLSLLEGESLREWLFFDTPRRAFESGNRKQRSLPDYNGRGWHESRKQVMKDFGGLKRSYYMDPQPSSNYEWHLFEYEINDSDALALYRLEYKSSDTKRSVKSKLTSSPLNEIQQQMVKLSADSPVENKRTARSRPKANQKDNNSNTYPAVNTPNQASASNAHQPMSLNTPNQASASNSHQPMSLNAPDQVNVSNAYQTVPPSQAGPSNTYHPASQMDQMTFLDGSVVYGPHLPYGYSTERSDFYWNPTDGT
ncbi:transcription factor VOZ1-like [Oryza brachyantha]|uniref:Transcription factor VOZ1 n=1 Tax=Oryza brachyantha TaxID=4533 RepID=J3M8V8_ORYBR|nr:transcription factor VOZ1-like [Oryza brachyantha]